MLQRAVPALRAIARARAFAPLCGAALALALTAAHADAAPYTAYLCEGPHVPSEPVGAAGLGVSEPVSGELARFSAACASPGEELRVELLPGAAGLATGEGGWFVYDPPADVTISAFALQAQAEAHSCGSGCSGEAFVRYRSGAGAEYFLRDSGEGSAAKFSKVGGLSNVHALEFGVACAEGSIRCYAEGPLATLAVPFGELTLEDRSTIAASVSSAPAQPLSGTVSWSYQASDPGGGGVFRIGELIDGHPLGEAHVIDEEGGRCRMLALSSVRAFVAPQPCPESVRSTLSLDTDTLTDGTHTLEAYVEAVAGGRATVLDEAVRVANAPTLAQPAVISGTPAVGSLLSAAAPIFAAPAGNVITAQSYQWERCTAGGCSPIPGASSLTYTPTSADRGARLELLASATDAASLPEPGDIAHTTTVASAQSAPVASSACAAVCTSLAGEASPWRLRFSVHPRRVHRHSRILLRGRVLSRPLPAAGKLIYLQARSIVRVRKARRRARVLRGGWITFMLLRSRRDGAFAAHYRFRLGGHHIYQFRAVAPAEGLFRNPTGASRPVTVVER